jgi:hypothetical protein
MPSLDKDEDKDLKICGATFDIVLNRVDLVDTTADSSTNLMRRLSAPVMVFITDNVISA